MEAIHIVDTVFNLHGRSYFVNEWINDGTNELTRAGFNWLGK